MNFDNGTMDVIFVGHEMAHVLSNYIAGQKHGVFSHDAPLIVQESFSHFGEALLEEEMLKRAETAAEKARVKTTFLAKEFDALSIIGFAKFEEELYKMVGKAGDPVPSYDAINDLFKKHNAELKQLTGEDPDVREMQPLWNILMQPPLTVGVYPVTKIMAAALHDEFERNPEQFRERYHAVMEAGGTMGVAKLWDSLLGNNVAEQKAFIDARLAKLADKMAAMKEEIASLPTISKAEESDAKATTQTMPNGDASDFPVMGAFTGAVAKRMAENEYRGRV